MIPKIFFSSRIDCLAERLIEQMDLDPMDPLEMRTILVPNGEMKHWLLWKIAEQKGIAMGLKILEVEQLFPGAVHPMQMFCLIYRALCEASDPRLVGYLQGKKGRILELARSLSSLFFQYGRFDASVFEPQQGDWQRELLCRLFVESPWRLPVHQNIKIDRPVICFGIDSLPPVYWEFLLGAPSLAIYLFSPCMEFWADLSSDFERKRLSRYWEKRGTGLACREALDRYLREGPKILSNWGKLGRETLQMLDQVDFEGFEAYPSMEPNTALHQIQSDLLALKQTRNLKLDDSIRVLLTGPSKLQEIEALRDEILQLGIPYHEISVLAPEIDSYLPLIQFVFDDEIPYRICGVDLSSESSFKQGLLRLLRLSSGRWGVEEVLSLFETSSFSRKRGWSSETLETYRSWAAAAGIDWGLDPCFRRTVLSRTFGEQEYQDHGSWEKGLDWLLNAVVRFGPFEVDPDLLEGLIDVLRALKELDFDEEKSLADWAERLEQAAGRFLMADPNDEADTAAVHFFQNFLMELRNFPDRAPFPIEVIFHLFNRPCSSQIHSSHLHAVRFSRLDDGALIPARALFLIGMDEESFPKVRTPSSLDLLRRKIPDGADFDRYRFLQALFSARDFLRISYGHLSPDEGKPVGPSFLVQDLLGITGPSICDVYRPSLFEKKKRLIWPRFVKTPLPDGELTLAVRDLRQLARHPWKFFLEKTHSIRLNDEYEESFSIQKGRRVRAALERPLEQVLEEHPLPPGLFGRALRLQIEETSANWEETLQEWDLKPFTLDLREHCTTSYWEGSRFVAPAIRIPLDRLQVSIVGEVHQASLGGLISTQDDRIGGTLKIWPEALIAAVSLGVSELRMLKSGKIKRIENPFESLKQFVRYYFHSVQAPSPLLPEWGDALLRKGGAEFEKKMGRKSMLPDPAADWVLCRADLPRGEEIYEDWHPLLQQTFEGVIGLYPSRGARAEV